MKAIKTALFMVLLSTTVEINAQQQKHSDKFALNAATHLLQAYKQQDWNQYVDLSYPGVVSYYGGKKRFVDFLTRSVSSNTGSYDTGQDQIGLVQMVDEAGNLQCVVQRTCPQLIDGKKATIVTYLIGQSDDGGRNWKYFDVSFTSPQDLAFVMPDISEKLKVPERKIVFHATEMAIN